MRPQVTAGRSWKGEAATDTVALPSDESLTYFSFVHDPVPDDTWFEMILLCLVRDPKTRQVETIEDRHTCGLFTIEAWTTMAAEAGLDVEALAQQQEPDDPDSAWSVVFCGTRASEL